MFFKTKQINFSLSSLSTEVGWSLGWYPSKWPRCLLQRQPTAGTPPNSARLSETFRGLTYLSLPSRPPSHCHARPCWRNGWLNAGKTLRRVAAPSQQSRWPWPQGKEYHWMMSFRPLFWAFYVTYSKQEVTRIYKVYKVDPGLILVHLAKTQFPGNAKPQFENPKTQFENTKTQFETPKTSKYCKFYPHQ